MHKYDKVLKKYRASKLGMSKTVIVSIIALGLIALSVIGLVGLGFLTKFIFSGKVEKGQYCIKLNKVQHNLTKVSVILLWIDIALNFIALLFLTVPGIVTTIHLVFLAFLAVGTYYLSRFALNATKMGHNYCIRMSKNEHTWAKVTVVVLWISVSLSILVGILGKKNNLEDE